MKIQNWLLQDWVLLAAGLGMLAGGIALLVECNGWLAKVGSGLLALLGFVVCAFWLVAQLIGRSMKKNMMH